jgi:cell fate regulator YaaT (PSP1 superfamily)
MDMKLIDVEYTFDNNKSLFYFTAEGGWIFASWSGFGFDL